MNPSAELAPVDEALARLEKAIEPLRDRETIPVDAALGRVLAQQVLSTVDVPGHDNSAMDGYAVNTADLGGEGMVSLPLGHVFQAGCAPGMLMPGTASRIFTGAPIPEGADAVIMQEDCEAGEGEVRLPGTVKPGQHIRRAGEDLHDGDLLFGPGRRLRPEDLGLIASVGVPEVVVYRQLRVALLTTGDELVPPGEPLKPGQIYDANSYTLDGLLTRMGFQTLTLGGLKDTLNGTRDALHEAAAMADVIITTGGVSVGDADYVKTAVEQLGALDLWRVAIKPGKPFAFGRVDTTPFIGLPGNPVSVFITFLILARPLLLRLQGVKGGSQPPCFTVKAAFKKDRPNPKRREYLRARLTQTPEGQRVELHDRQGSGVLSSCAWADGLVMVEPGETVGYGDEVRYMPLVGFG